MSLVHNKWWQFRLRFYYGVTSTLALLFLKGGCRLPIPDSKKKRGPFVVLAPWPSARTVPNVVATAVLSWLGCSSTAARH